MPKKGKDLIFPFSLSLGKHDKRPFSALSHRCSFSTLSLSLAQLLPTMANGNHSGGQPQPQPNPQPNQNQEQNQQLPTSSSSTTLSTDSPPFNPRRMSSKAQLSSPGPHNGSRSDSPSSHGSVGNGGNSGTGGNGGNGSAANTSSSTAVSGSAHSNAVPKHTFQYGG